MKSKFKKVGIGVLVLMAGGATVFASTNIFGKLDQIESNYNIVFNIAKSKTERVVELETELNNIGNEKTQLEQDVASLQQAIEDLKVNHATEITNKNSEIQAKQDEINAKIAEINEKNNRINELNNELGEIKGTLAQVEARVDSLLNHTNAGVEELLNE